MLSIAVPIIGSEEKRAVAEVLESGVLAQGKKVAELEEKFAAYCGTKYAVAVSSGTAAIHSALYSCDVRPGDEVITTPFSFIATVNPILMQGARPIFVDIRESDFNIDSSLIERSVSSKTKAILAVSLYGQPYEYDEVSNICRSKNLGLIEDSCQAIGATYIDRKAGNLGDVGCFSLYATKNIMSGEGGVLTTNDLKKAEAAKRFRQHGMIGPYEYAELGYNYRMTDVLAAIAVEQLKKADSFNRARLKNAQALTRGLKNIKGIITPQILESRTHVYHQYTIRVTEQYKHSREELINILKEADIGSGIYYPKPLHLYPHIAKLGYKKGDFPVAERVCAQVLSLPVHPRVSSSEIEKIVKVFQENS